MSIKDIKQGTVAFQKYRMMETYGVKTNAELIKYAINISFLAPSY
jgi:hypothetical protein